MPPEYLLVFSFRKFSHEQMRNQFVGKQNFFYGFFKYTARYRKIQLCNQLENFNTAIYFIAIALSIDIDNFRSWLEFCKEIQNQKNLKIFLALERFHSRDQHLYKFIETKRSVYIRKEFNSHRICLVHQHRRRFIVLEHQYGRRDVM